MLFELLEDSDIDVNNDDDVIENKRDEINEDEELKEEVDNV